MEHSTFGLAALAMMIIVPIIIFAVSMLVLEIIALWFLFEKAGEPGWAARTSSSFLFLDLGKQPIPEINQILMLKQALLFY